MSTYPLVPLAGVATVRSGYAFKSSDWTESGVPVLKIANIHSGLVDLAGCGFVDEATAAKAQSFTVERDDSLIAMSGASVGKVGRVRFSERALVNQRVGRFSVLDPAKLDADFLYYSLQLPATVDYLTGSAYGSAQPNISPSLILNAEIPLPSLSEQKSITDLLCSLDDKIAANNKLARLTNDLADSVFRQALLKAEFSNETFADISRVSGGGTPSTKQPEYWNGDVLWATPTDVTALMAPYLEGTSRTITEEGLSACASELYPAGTILMTSRATIGSFALTQFPTAVNQGFIVVQPTDKNLRYWIFHEMRSRVAEFTAFANGATFLELSRGNFKNFRVRQAPYDVMVKFNETAGSLHKLGRAAIVENQTLSSVRDTLLPQLMSGKIRVRDAEAIVEDVL